jgi:hypothetical protein
MRQIIATRIHPGVVRASRRQAIAGLTALLFSAALTGRARALTVFTRAQVFTPQPGSQLRAEILNALRPAVARGLGGAIEFAVSSLRVLGDWAYASVRPQRPAGRPIDWRATRFRAQREQGVMDDDVLALLRRDAGGWRVVEYVIGPTDVYWENWVAPYKLPRSLFGDQ